MAPRGTTKSTSNTPTPLPSRKDSSSRAATGAATATSSSTTTREASRAVVDALGESSDPRLAEALNAVKLLLESYQSTSSSSSTAVNTKRSTTVKQAPPKQSTVVPTRAATARSESPRLGRKRNRDPSPPPPAPIQAEEEEVEEENEDDSNISGDNNGADIDPTIQRAIEAIYDDLDGSLESLVADVRTFLAKKHTDLMQGKLQEIQEMEQYFAEGVEAWEHTVDKLIRDLEERQQNLNGVLSSALDFINDEADKYRDAQKKEDEEYETDIQNILESAALELEAEGMAPLDRAEMFAARSRRSSVGGRSIHNHNHASSTPIGEPRSSTREGALRFGSQAATAVPKSQSNNTARTATSKSWTVARALSGEEKIERERQERSVSEAVDRVRPSMSSIFSGLRSGAVSKSQSKSAAAAVAGTTDAPAKSSSRAPPMSAQTTPGKGGRSAKASPSPRLKSRSKQ